LGLFGGYELPILGVVKNQLDEILCSGAVKAYSTPKPLEEPSPPQHRYMP